MIYSSYTFQDYYSLVIPLHAYFLPSHGNGEALVLGKLSQLNVFGTLSKNITHSTPREQNANKLDAVTSTMEHQRHSLLPWIACTKVHRASVLAVGSILSNPATMTCIFILLPSYLSIIFPLPPYPTPFHRVHPPSRASSSCIYSQCAMHIAVGPRAKGYFILARPTLDPEFFFFFYPIQPVHLSYNSVNGII